MLTLFFCRFAAILRRCYVYATPLLICLLRDYCICCFIDGAISPCRYAMLLLMPPDAAFSCFLLIFSVIISLPPVAATDTSFSLSLLIHYAFEPFTLIIERSFFIRRLMPPLFFAYAFRHYSFFISMPLPCRYAYAITHYSACVTLLVLRYYAAA